MALLDPLLLVHAQHTDGRASFGSLARKRAIRVESKMVVPSLLAGVEEPCRHTGLRVYHGDFWSLILIAVGASKAQIVKQSATSMPDWDDVIDLEHGWLSAIANSAIFTASPGSLEYIAALLRRWSHEGRPLIRNSVLIFSFVNIRFARM